MHLETILTNFISARFKRPAVRRYEVENLYERELEAATPIQKKGGILGKSEPKKKPQSGGFFQKFFRKPEKSQKEQRLTVQRSIPYLEMGRDGICRVEEHLYSKTVRFYDINYQLAQNEDKTPSLKAGATSSTTSMPVSVFSFRSSIIKVT